MPTTSIIDIGAIVPYVPEPQNTLRSGQWVKFELNGDPQIVAIYEKHTLVLHPSQIDSLALQQALGKTQKSQDGRYVGIHLQAARTPLGVDEEDGKPAYAYMPAVVVPQRTDLGLFGEQNFSYLFNGREQVLQFKLDSLRMVEGVGEREDLPTHRDATCRENWNPRA